MDVVDSTIWSHCSKRRKWIAISVKSFFSANNENVQFRDNLKIHFVVFLFVVRSYILYEFIPVMSCPYSSLFNMRWMSESSRPTSVFLPKSVQCERSVVLRLGFPYISCLTWSKQNDRSISVQIERLVYLFESFNTQIWGYFSSFWCVWLIGLQKFCFFMVLWWYSAFSIT